MLMESSPHLTRKLLRVVFNAREISDRELLARFVSNRDEDAFAELVRRHGPMVFATARRVTGHAQDAEDAFQATFLVLARRASQVQKPEQLGNWLYGVAYRTALEVRSARRRVLEHSVSVLPESAAPTPPEDTGDLRRVIHEELAALPEKYREAVVLCDLEGLPRAVASSRLEIPEGTLSSRLLQARKMLAARLTRRGVTATSGSLAGLFSVDACSNAVPIDLVLRAAHVAVAATGGAPNLVSPSVSQLAEGVMKVMLANQLRQMVLTGLLASGLLGLGAYGAAQIPAGSPTQPPPAKGGAEREAA